MAGITLHSENNKTVTCVPNVFIDELMADADGEFVKIYLYLLRCMNASDDSLSISKMADKFENTEKDIRRALKYWEKANVLHLEYDQDKKLSGICLTDTSTFASKDTCAKEEKQTEIAAVTPENASKEVKSVQPILDSTIKKPEYSLEEMQNFQQDSGVQELLFITETYIGHTLNTTDINCILYWHDSLSFSMELIEYLIEYCVGKGHKNMRYMDKVALAWHEAGISSVSKAKEMNTRYSKANTAVMKAYGISGRNLVDVETKFIEKWTGTYGFSLEIITEACKRTMTSIHQPSFEYTDSILNNWKKKNVTNIDQISALDAAFLNQKPKVAPQAATRTTSSNRFNNFSQRSYNFEQLEKQALNSSMQS